MENYYEILEISEKASDEIIKKAYNVFVKKYHPDVVPKDKKAFAEEKIKKINEAYETLSNPQKRKAYDEELYSLREEEQRIKYVNQFQASSTIQNAETNQNFNPNLKTQNNIKYEQIQQEIHNELKRKAQEDYAKAYHNYLRSLGFKIRYKKTFKDYLVIFITILIFALIGFIIWKIPYTHNKLLEIYNSNPIINFIVNFIAEAFKNIFGK